MHRAGLTSLAGIFIVCACGGRTPIEDYGYHSSSRTSVLNRGGEGGNGSGGRNSAGVTGVGGSDEVPPPLLEPPIDRPPVTPPSLPPQMPPTCNQSTTFTDAQSLQGSLSTGVGSFQSICGGAGLEEHYSFVAPYTGLFTFDTFGSALDTVLSVHDVDCFGAELICNDDNGGTWSRVEVSLTADQQVAVRVDDYSNGGGAYTLRGWGSGDLSCANYELGSSTGPVVASGSLNFEPIGQESVCGGAGLAFSARWTAPYDGYFQFDTIGSTFDSVLAVQASCSGGSLACNDDFSGLASGVNLQLFAGQSVLLLLNALGNGAQPGNDHYELNITEIFSLP
jgi:hypothetical protein